MFGRFNAREFVPWNAANDDQRRHHESRSVCLNERQRTGVSVYSLYPFEKGNQSVEPGLASNFSVVLAAL